MKKKLRIHYRLMRGRARAWCGDVRWTCDARHEAAQRGSCGVARTARGRAGPRSAWCGARGTGPWGPCGARRRLRLTAKANVASARLAAGAWWAPAACIDSRRLQLVAANVGVAAFSRSQPDERPLHCRARVLRAVARRAAGLRRRADDGGKAWSCWRSASGATGW